MKKKTKNEKVDKSEKTKFPKRTCVKDSKAWNRQYRKSRSKNKDTFLNPVSTNPLNLDFKIKRLEPCKFKDDIPIRAILTPKYCLDVIPEYLSNRLGHQYQLDISYNKSSNKKIRTTKCIPKTYYVDENLFY